MTILAVFRSRAHTLDFLNAIKAAGIPAQAVSTPREAGVGCGISVRFDARFLPRAKTVLAARRDPSFAGFLRAGPGGWFFYDRP